MANKQVIVWVVGMPCGVVSFLILMACLWEYRVIIGAAMFLLIFLVVVIYIRGQITEQNLRIYRFNHNEETPLDITGEPKFFRADMKENPHRMGDQQQVYYQRYRQE